MPSFTDENTEYVVKIKGNIGDFIKMSETAHDLGNLVANKSTVEFGLTSKDLSNLGGAATYEKGEIGNANVRVLVNPKQIRIADSQMNPNSVFGAQFCEKEIVNPFTPGVAAWHEFGHAWGYINGRIGAARNSESFQWENRMREQLHGPHCPNRARRAKHIEQR